MQDVPTISLTRFVDFVAKSGTPKFTVARETKKQLDEGYHPSQDFYLGFRKAVVRFHRDGLKSAEFRRLTTTSDKKKSSHYKELTDGYLKFLGRKSVDALPAPKRVVWDQGDLRVSVNPEVAVRVREENILVKLYLKTPELRKTAADISICLIRSSAPRKFRKGWNAGILDVRRGKLFVATPQKHDLLPLLEGEAASFASILASLRDSH